MRTAAVVQTAESEHSHRTLRFTRARVPVAKYATPTGNDPGAARPLSGATFVFLPIRHGGQEESMEHDQRVGAPDPARPKCGATAPQIALRSTRGPRSRQTGRMWRRFLDDFLGLRPSYNRHSERTPNRMGYQAIPDHRPTPGPYPFPATSLRAHSSRPPRGRKDEKCKLFKPARPLPPFPSPR